MHQDRSLRALLREATHDQHIRLHKHPLLATIMQPNYQLSDYHRLLLAYFGLYQFVEARIQQYLNNESVSFSYNERYKLPWLVNDLAYRVTKQMVTNPITLDYNVTSMPATVSSYAVYPTNTAGLWSCNPVILNACIQLYTAAEIGNSTAVVEGNG